MKTNNKNIALSALLAAFSLITLGLDSCVKDQFDESLGDRVTITLTAENPGFASDAAPASKSVAGDSTATAGNSAEALAPVLLDSTATLEESIAALGDRIVYSDSTMFICAPQGMAPDTKTGMTADGTPFWEPGDQIGLITRIAGSTAQWKHEFLTNDNLKPTCNTTFSGTIQNRANYLWAYYPYNKNISTVTADKKIELSISAQQTPKRSSSFDGNSDILCGVKRVDAIGDRFGSNLDSDQSIFFKRKVGFIKLVLYEDTKPTPTKLNDPIKFLIITSDTKTLAGACVLDLDTPNNPLNVTGSEKSVTIDYSAVGGSSEAIISVFPQSLAGSTLKVSGETVGGKKFNTKGTPKSLPENVFIDENKYTIFGHLVAVENILDSKPGEISKTDAWQNFIDTEKALKEETDEATRNKFLANRILLDYSYAGYQYGEQIPPPTDTKTNSNIVYNINEEINKLSPELKKDDISDARQAFMNCVDKHNNGTGKSIFYFPSSGSPYILHNDFDNTNNDSTIDQDKKDILGHIKSNPIMITRGNFVIVGDGDGSVIEMKSENLPDGDALYDSPEMLIIKSPTAFNDKDNFTPSAIVVDDAPRGTKSVVIDRSISTGWYCLFLNKQITDKQDKSVVYDFEGHPAENHMKEIIGDPAKNKKGYLKVREFHKVISCTSIESGRFRVEFYEPIMRDVNIEREGKNQWQLRSYSPIEEIGIENIRFMGHAKSDFWHHHNWRDDGGYKPLQLTRVANSWIRNVTFESVSECATFATSVNCSAYNIKIIGNRGHSGVRAMTSTRIFLGNIIETSHGMFIPAGQKPEGNDQPNAGQYHASGVSKPSIGTVLWRNHWGKDATFESHSSQPRATLVDCCKGGWVEWRFGGAQDRVPNHLRDLTIWNFYSERAYLRYGQMDNYLFWDHTGINTRPDSNNPDKSKKESWRVAPPILVGFHGIEVPIFNNVLSKDNTPKDDNSHPGQLKHYEASYNDPGNDSMGSLYEAQLYQRQIRENITLPWLTELQSIRATIVK